MFRGRTACTLYSALAALLLTLPFFTSTASFAHAYTARHAEAEAQPGTNPSGKALRAEDAACHHNTQFGDPTGPLRIRDRHRAVDSAPCAPERPPPSSSSRGYPQPARDQGTDSDAGVRNAAHDHASRPSTAHSPAALQVFRC